MGRRTKHQSRLASTMGDSKIQGGLPSQLEPDNLAPFAESLPPHFLLMQRYKMKHIKGTKKSMMNYKPFVTFSKQRKPNTKALDQGCIVNKIDRFDRIVDKQSMKLYIQ